MVNDGPHDAAAGVFTTNKVKAAPVLWTQQVIRGGRVVLPDSVVEASVAIKDGKILAVGADEAMPPANETLDAQGMHVLPGAIDVHVHFRDPGYPHKEDFASGTAAAANAVV